MQKNVKAESAKKSNLWRRTSVVAIASTVLLGGYIPQIHANSEPLQISQRQQDWNAVVGLARLVNANQQTTDLVLQLDVLDKPETSYANAVYQIFARRNGQLVSIYTSTGARLIASQAGRITLPPEVISLSDLQRQLGSNVNLADLELQAVVQLRYDVRGGRRDQRLEWRQTQTYAAIAQTTNTQVVSTSTTTQTEGSTVVTSPSRATSTRRNDTQSQGQFSLAIRQQQVTLPEVIARVSLKSRQSDSFVQERFIGDFRYQMNQRARFVQGLSTGDRVVVRLFTPQNQLIGYSEFELLASNAAVNLVLPNQPTQYKVTRTVYGIDADENGTIDQGSSIYDYFSQVTGSTFSNSQVVFLSNSQSITTSLFQIQGLPTPPVTSTYTNSFLTGSFSLISRTIQVFSSGLAPALTALPGQLVQIVSLSSSSVSIYQVNQLITTYQEVGVSPGTVVVDNDRNNRNGRPQRRNCNQGIGNGSEGCDPGNSRPHGGSNDETGRTPGGNRRGGRR